MDYPAKIRHYDTKTLIFGLSAGVFGNSRSCAWAGRLASWQALICDATARGHWVCLPPLEKIEEFYWHLPFWALRT